MSKILDLLLPTPCIICSKLGSALCKICQSNFPTSFIPIELSGVGGFAVSEYTSEAALLVNAVKEKGLTSLLPAMADLVTKSWTNELLSPIFVPLPSSPANLKKRGFSHTTLLAKQLAKRIPSSSVRELLRSTRSRADQVGLDPQGRTQNMAGAFRAELRGFQDLDRPVVLVDDVLTSGASMASAIKALAESGISVASFCVIARAGSN